MVNTTDVIFMFHFGTVCVITLLVFGVIAVLISWKVKDSECASKICKMLLIIWCVGIAIGLAYVVYYYRGNLLQQVFYIIFGVLLVRGLRYIQNNN